MTSPIKLCFTISLFTLIGIQIYCEEGKKTSKINAIKVLGSVVKHPRLSYKGRVTVTKWFGKKTRSEEANVYYSYPNHYRWEYLTPDGGIDRIVVGDGKVQSVYLPDDKVLIGKGVNSVRKMMDKEKEWSLLFFNYEATILGEEERLGRTVWILELKPLSPGKPRQHLMVDQKTYVVLENRRFRPGSGKIASLTKYDWFEPIEKLPDTLFEIKKTQDREIVDHGLDPDFLSYEDMEEAWDQGSDIPEAFPSGFVFESGNTFDVLGETVGHYRYTDGLAILSVFVSDQPVSKKFKKEAAPITDHSHANPILLTTSGRVIFKKGENQYYTLVGDLSKKVLKSASELLP
ncbi:hypothetical protein BVX98_07375 [bacterium F11]|nr:hypothetical protein BVX98_07375 [bacterium F11]